MCIHINLYMCTCKHVNIHNTHMLGGCMPWIRIWLRILQAHLPFLGELGICSTNDLRILCSVNVASGMRPLIHGICEGSWKNGSLVGGFNPSETYYYCYSQSMEKVKMLQTTNQINVRIPQDVMGFWSLSRSSWQDSGPAYSNGSPHCIIVIHKTCCLR